MFISFLLNISEGCHILHHHIGRFLHDIDTDEAKSLTGFVLLFMRGQKWKWEMTQVAYIMSILYDPFEICIIYDLHISRASE